MSACIAIVHLLLPHLFLAALMLALGRDCWRCSLGRSKYTHLGNKLGVVRDKHIARAAVLYGSINEAFGPDMLGHQASAAA